MATATSNQSFLRDVMTLDVDDSHPTPETGTPSVDRAINGSLTTGVPSIQQSLDGEDDCVALSIPIYRGGLITSLVVFVGQVADNAVGVMETWQPIGEYEELNLTQGYYGSLDRFQNVSSFVRFEKGAGLPGQVWRNLSCIIHDNLPSHPGFLRAAGASAESLQVALGIPVFGEHFLASALLVSSDASPIAQGYEVWRYAEDSFLLESRAYQRLEKSLIYEGDTTLPVEGTLPGLAVAKGGAATTTDPNVVFSGRPFRQGGQCKGVAIPIYEDDRLTNVLTLML